MSEYYDNWVNANCDPNDIDEPTPEEVEADRAYRAWWDAMYAANALPGESSADCYRRLEAQEDEATYAG